MAGGHRLPACRLQIEAEAKAAAEQAQKQREEEDSENEGKPERGRKPKPFSDIPVDNKQYNFTDPESKIMKVSNKGWEQCISAEAAVDSNNQIIVACDVTKETNDK